MSKRLIRLLLLTLAVMLIAGLLTMSASATRGYSYKAMYGTPVIDGEIDDIWAEAQDAHLIWNYANGVSETIPLSRCHVFVMHDDTYIYVLAVIHDYSPTTSDSLEIYIDEEFTQLSTAQVDEQFGRGNFPDYTYQLGIPVKGMSAFDMSYGPKGAQAKDKTIVEDIQCKTIPNVRDSLGRYSIYQLEVKLHPVKAIPSSGKWGIEFMYNDINGNTGNFINALRWNCDTVTEDGTGKDDFPYQSTISYAPITFAALGVDVTPDVPLYPVERQTDKPLETYHEPETESAAEPVTETESEKATETESEKATETEIEPSGSQTETEPAEVGAETAKETEPDEPGTEAAPETGAPETTPAEKTTDKEIPGKAGCGSVVVSGAVLLALCGAAGIFLLRRKDG